MLSSDATNTMTPLPILPSASHPTPNRLGIIGMLERPLQRDHVSKGLPGAFMFRVKLTATYAWNMTAQDPMPARYQSSLSYTTCEMSVHAFRPCL
jgi:hypothetical protein